MVLLVQILLYPHFIFNNISAKMIRKLVDQ